MRIFNLRSLLPLVIVMIGVACVKDPQDIPPGLTGDPEFGMTAHFGSQAIDLDAGINNWTFVPVVKELDSLPIYTAVLSQNGCIDQCSSSWTFNFYQASWTTSDEEQKFKNTIHEGPVDFVLSDSERDSFQVSISTHPDLFMNGVSFWEDPASSEIIYENELSHAVGSQNVFSACFQSVVYAGCQYNQCVEFKPSTLSPCLMHIEATVESGRYVVLTAVPEGTAPFHIQWADGPTASSVVLAAAHPVQDFYADVTVIDANGNRAHLVQTIRLQDSIVDVCYYPINITSTPFTDQSAALGAGDAEIRYLDDNGVEWISTGGVQPTDAFMQIKEVSSYGPSPLGMPAYKVSLAVHALLTNSSTGESRWFDSDDVVLPLAHPE